MWAKKNKSSSSKEEKKSSTGSALDTVDAATAKQFKFSSGTSKEEIRLQVTKFKEIIEFLHAAGYYRSKMTAISLFDRVIGGLCWSISNAGISPNYIGPSMTNISIDGNSLVSVLGRKGAISTWDMKQVEILKKERGELKD